MSGVAIGLLVLLVLFVLLALVVGSAHGRLSALRNAVENAWARVNQQLGRRHDAASEADEAADAVGKAEEARAGFTGPPEDPDAVTALIAAEDGLAADRDRLDFACDAYNEAVARYDDYRGRFPGGFVAGLFGLPEALPVAMTGAGPDSPAAED